MKQFKGIVVGGWADGESMAATRPQMELIRRPPLGRLSIWDSLDVTPTEPVKLERKLHNYMEYLGLGFWIPADSPIDTETALLVALYIGYRQSKENQ